MLIEFCLRHDKSDAALQSLKTIMNVYMGQEQYITPSREYEKY